MATGALTVEKLTQRVGALVHGISLANIEGQEQQEFLNSSLVEHKVLFFRDQHLDPTQLVRLASVFGELTPAHPLVGGLDDAHPEVLVLDSTNYLLGVGDNAGSTSYNNRWHTDVTFAQTPPAVTVLSAVVVPAFGGDTLWGNLEAAWDALPADLRVDLESARAVHWTGKTFERMRANAEGAETLKEIAEVTHPLVRVHPESGKRSAFVNPTFTKTIEGWDPLEADRILSLIYEIASSPECTVRWRWQAGDVAIWDNRSTMHYASADYEGRRLMHRVTVAGDLPFGP
jgi:taurine dioxygenase